MKNLHKNPVLYYMLIPLLMGMWPLLLQFRYLPLVNESLRQQKQDMADANDLILAILDMAPDRAFHAENAGGGEKEFVYRTAINEAAKKCRMAAPRRSEDQRTKKNQTATVNLYGVNIVKCSMFLSELQTSWRKLQCTQINLTKKKGLKDRWKVSLRFNYYF